MSIDDKFSDDLFDESSVESDENNYSEIFSDENEDDYVNNTDNSKGNPPNYRVQLLPVYAFLRTLSLDLQLSPFDVEVMIDGIIYNTSRNSSREMSSVENSLLNEIHYTLILACVSLIEDESCLQPPWKVAWTLLDRWTWPEFLLPLFQMWIHHYDEYIAFIANDIAQEISYCKERKIIYADFNVSLKVKILQGMMSIIMNSEVVSYLMEKRESLKFNGDPFPLYKKGSDGYPDVCIACGEGGDLLCCEYCPASYHRHCLYEKNSSVFDGEWQCYECIIPDPLQGRSQLPWYKCKGGYLTFVGNLGIFKSFLRCAINDYSEIQLCDINKLLPGNYLVTTNVLVDNLHWKQFLYYIGRLIHRRWYIVKTDDANDNINEEEFYDNNNFENCKTTQDFNQLEDKNETMTVISDDSKYSDDNYNDTFEDFEYGSNSKSRQTIKSLSSGNKRGRPAKTQKINELSKNKEYIQIDRLRTLNDTAFISFLDLKRVQRANIDISVQYLNHYRNVVGSTTFFNIRKQLLSNRFEMKPIKRTMESIFHSIGFLHSLPQPGSSKSFLDPWLLRLYEAKTPKELSELLLILSQHIEPKLFKREWYMPPCELECLTSFGKIKHLKLPIEESKKRRISPKKNLLRVTEFAKVNISKLFLSNLPFSNLHNCTSSSIKSDPSHQIRSSSPTQSNNGSCQDEESCESSPNFLQERNNEFTVFRSGNRLLHFEERCLVPKRFLKRLARNGGLGFIPTVSYSAESNVFASAPFFWHWNYRVKNCSSIENIYLQLKYLEEALDNTVQSNLMNSAPPNYLIDSSSCQGFILSVNKKNAITKCIKIENCYSISRVENLECESTSTNLIFTKYTKQPPEIEYEIISSFPDIGKAMKYVDISLGNLSSFKMRKWIFNLLENVHSKEEIRHLQRFANLTYDILCQSGYSEDDDMMVHREVRPAVHSERLDARARILSNLINCYPQSSKQFIRFLEGSVDNILDKIVMSVSELVKFDFVNNFLQRKSKSAQYNTRNSHIPDNIENSNLMQSLHIESKFVSEFVNKPAFTSGPLFYLNKIFTHGVKQKRKVHMGTHSNSVQFKPRVISHKDVALTDFSYCYCVSQPNHTYLPQVGDEVIYFAVGHLEYSLLYTDGNRAERKGLIKKQNESENGVCCRILTIDYEFPLCPSSNVKGVQMVIQLGVCSGQQEVSIKSFTVVYMPGHKSAEFLVLRKNLESIFEKKWEVGMKFQMLYEGGDLFKGSILSLKRDSNGIPVWAGAGVSWENWGDDRVNEWELDIFDESLFENKTKKKQKDSKRKSNFQYNTEETNDVVHDSSKLKSINENLLFIVEKLLEDPDYEAFRDFVDDSVAPDYSCYVPVCMYLKLMRDRASAHYYRQPAALLGDARTLYSNCAFYNLEQSPLTLAAANLYRAVLRELTMHFPGLLFDEYTSFDVCLGNKQHVSSLLEGPNFVINDAI